MRCVLSRTTPLVRYLQLILLTEIKDAPLVVGTAVVVAVVDHRVTLEAAVVAEILEEAS